MIVVTDMCTSISVCLHFNLFLSFVIFRDDSLNSACAEGFLLALYKIGPDTKKV